MRRGANTYLVIVCTLTASLLVYKYFFDEDDVDRLAKRILKKLPKGSDTPAGAHKLPHEEEVPLEGAALGRQDQGGQAQGMKTYVRGIGRYSEGFMEKLKVLTDRKATAKDPELVSLIREIIDPPSKSGGLKMSQYATIKTPQAKEVELILKNKTGGFFVECGAFDGERSSNTLYLEKLWKWTGLLVEMDPFFYAQVLGKNRKSYAINACLSPYNYVIEMPFFASSGGQGKLSFRTGKAAQDLIKMPCFPFEAIMLAIDVNHIDYFSLDVEGVELQILKTLPFDTVSMDVFSVEYGHAQSVQNETIELMTSKDYVYYKKIHKANPSISLYVEDFIFVKKHLVDASHKFIEEKR